MSSPTSVSDTPLAPPSCDSLTEHLIAMPMSISGGRWQYIKPTVRCKCALATASPTAQPQIGRRETRTIHDAGTTASLRAPRGSRPRCDDSRVRPPRLHAKADTNTPQSYPPAHPSIQLLDSSHHRHAAFIPNPTQSHQFVNRSGILGARWEIPRGLLLL